MRVRTTIFLLLLLAGTAFVAGLFKIRRAEEEKFKTIAEERNGAWTNSVVDFLQQKHKPLETLVGQYASVEAGDSPREGTLAMLLSKNRELAHEVWDDKTWATLRNFEASAVWIYDADGSLFYSFANTEKSALAALPDAVGSVPRLFVRGKPPHFYFFLPGVATHGKNRRVVEVRGLPIRSVNDQDGKTPPQGYFLAGRVWGGQMLQELPLLSSDDRVAIMTPDESDPVVFGESHMSHEEFWPDSQGRNIARLVITNESAPLTELEARSRLVFRWLVVGACALFAFLFFFLESAIVRPLRRVIQSLHTENMKPLEPLRGQKAEFGELARLIQAFFIQRAELMREMHERSAAEKALSEKEEMLRHSQKMEAVGRLAGGVAHDFNNLLTAIIGYADLLRQRFAGNPAARQPAELIHQAGEQAAGLTRQLLAFSRKQLLLPRVIDLNTIIANLHRLLQRIIGEHIEIIVQPTAENPRVKADPGQIEQVIVNLGVNARDAMPGGGKLTIRTRNATVSEAQPVPELIPGEYVVMEVTDTGEGMDAETKTRIFEPFFTTKGPGKGTGLGLATVYGIVRQSRGGIAVESERGQGSTFRIYLPQDQGALETAAIAPPVAKSAARDESILVVEDEAIVRDLVCEILQSEGYRVFATDRGTEALRLLREEKREIDLLISDVVMPEMNGAQVARHVHELCPRARVLFVSGYSENDMADQGLEALAFQVLQKPFTPDALTQKVRAVLDAS